LEMLDQERKRRVFRDLLGHPVDRDLDGASHDSISIGRPALRTGWIFF
jgi:hypothetical protein